MQVALIPVSELPVDEREQLERTSIKLAQPSSSFAITQIGSEYFACLGRIDYPLSPGTILADLPTDDPSKPHR